MANQYCITCGEPKDPKEFPANGEIPGAICARCVLKAQESEKQDDLRAAVAKEVKRNRKDQSIHVAELSSALLAMYEGDEQPLFNYASALKDVLDDLSSPMGSSGKLNPPGTRLNAASFPGRLIIAATQYRETAPDQSAATDAEIDEFIKKRIQIEAADNPEFMRELLDNNGLKIADEDVA